MQALLVDVFTSSRGKGNPAAVVLESDGLTSAEMARAAAKAGLADGAVSCEVLRSLPAAWRFDAYSGGLS